MSLQVFFDQKEDGKPTKLPGVELCPEGRVYKNMDNPEKVSFLRKSLEREIRVWKCFGETEKGEKCRFLALSSAHLKQHLQTNHYDRHLKGRLKSNHDGGDPLTLPENEVVLEKTSPENGVVLQKTVSKRRYVMVKRRNPENPRKVKLDISDQMWKFQDMFVGNSDALDVQVSSGIHGDFFYDESEQSQASTTETTPTKNDSSLGSHSLVLESALENIDASSFVQSLFAE